MFSLSWKLWILYFRHVEYLHRESGHRASGGQPLDSGQLFTNRYNSHKKTPFMIFRGFASSINNWPELKGWPPLALCPLSLWRYSTCLKYKIHNLQDKENIQFSEPLYTMGQMYFFIQFLNQQTLLWYVAISPQIGVGPGFNFQGLFHKYCFPITGWSDFGHQIQRHSLVLNLSSLWSFYFDINMILISSP